MVQVSLNPNITFLGEKLTGSLKPKKYQCYIRKKSKNAYKKRKNDNFEKQKKMFLSRVPLITQPKNQVPRSKGTDTKVNTEDTLSGFQEFFLSTYHQGLVQ